MRIVIETDQPDEGQDTTRAAETQQESPVSDGGPAPAALLRRFGRIPQDQAETAGTGPGTVGATATTTDGIAGEADSEGGEVNLNPLRYGAAVAARQHERGGRGGAGDKAGKDTGESAAEDPTAR